MAAPDYFSVADFEKTQHYKNRNPPWIRLYYEILDKPEFIALDPASRSYYLMLQLIASKQNNVISNNKTYLKMVLRLDKEPDLTPLFESGLLLAYSKKRASVVQRVKIKSGIPKADNSDNSDSSKAEYSEPPLPPKVNGKGVKTTWPPDFSLTEPMADYAREKGIANPQDEFDHFRDSALAKGYKYLDWERAWQNWCRSPYQQAKRQEDYYA